MKASTFKSFIIYLLLAVVCIGSSHSFAFSPAASQQGEQEVLQQNDHNLPLFSEEIEGTVLLQVVSGKPWGNQGALVFHIPALHLNTGNLSSAEPSVYAVLQKDLIRQQIFPFHFFW